MEKGYIVASNPLMSDTLTNIIDNKVFTNSCFNALLHMVYIGHNSTAFNSSSYFKTFEQAKEFILKQSPYQRLRCYEIIPKKPIEHYDTHSHCANFALSREIPVKPCYAKGGKSYKDIEFTDLFIGYKRIPKDTNPTDCVFYKTFDEAKRKYKSDDFHVAKIIPHPPIEYDNGSICEIGNICSGFTIIEYVE